jgi:hypothetical protein
MATITPRGDVSLHGDDDHLPIIDVYLGEEHPVPAPCLEDQDVIRLHVPRGMTAAEAQHRLATWETLRMALDELIGAAVEYSNEVGVSGKFGARLYDARAALAASETRP